jgi:hypothetical protein
MELAAIRDKRRQANGMRVLTAAFVWTAVLLAASPDLRAAEPSPVWKDGWTINLPGRSNWVSDGTPSPFYVPGTPATSFGLSAADPYKFSNYSIGHSFGRDLGLGNMQATLGVRMAEPLASTGFTPPFDPRRYMGAGPRVGLEGNLGFDGSKAPRSSWVVEWQVGASALFGDRTFETSGGVVNPAVPSFSNSGSVLGIDGLLGLSYWFDSASKLTLGYRADYFKGAPSANITGTAAESNDRVNHGPMIRFSIQK